MDSYTDTLTTQAQIAVESASLSVWTLAFGALCIIFLIYSGVLIFHWFSYSMHPRVPIFVTILYLAIGAVFLFFLLASVLALTTL